MTKNPPEERLVNLVVALVATEQGVTKDTILSSVAGYREQREAGVKSMSSGSAYSAIGTR